MKTICIFLVVLLLISCSPNSSKTKSIQIDLTGTKQAELVAPGIINQGFYVRDLTMTPDQTELYYSISMGRFTYSHIACVKKTNGQWQEPELVSFANNPKFRYLEPSISPDGKRFFFVTNQTNGVLSKKLITDIWAADRNGDKWSEPYKLDSTVNSPSPEFFPSATNDGTLYFTREDENTRKNFIYRSKFDGKKYLPAEKLPEQVNIGIDRFNATIAADETFIIIPAYGMEDSSGSIDYYVSFRNDDDQWSNPINLGEKVNTESNDEYSASFSPDGKTMYFMSTRPHKPDQESISFSDLKSLYLKPENGKANIYKISSAFIEGLKEQAVYN